MADDPVQNQSASTPSSPAESPDTSVPDVTPTVTVLPDIASPPADPVVPNQTNETSTPINPESPAPTVVSSAPEASTGDSNNMASPENQTPQVQSAPPTSIPGDINNSETNTSSHSAEIKREPIQPVQNAPSADSTSPKTSFGDILRGNSPPISPPSSPQQPSVLPPKAKSFGDLLKDSSTPPI